MPLYIGLAVIAAIVLYVISVYNGLQRLKTQIAASVQEVGNQLKRQASLIPNLETSVKGYLKHEKDIFKMLTDARKSVVLAEQTGKLGDIEKAVDNLQALLPRMNIMVESNPEMKADGTVTKFMDELRDTADKLMYARRSIIDLTQLYNERLVTFPSNLIAGTFGFKAEPGLQLAPGDSHLKVTNEEMQDVKVNL